MDRPRRPPSEPEPEPDPIYDTIPSDPPPDVIRERRRASRPSGRFFVDPKAEASVVDEWTASIAAEASRARASDPVIQNLTPPPAPVIHVPVAPPGEPLDPSEILDTLPVPRKRKRSSSAPRLAAPNVAPVETPPPAVPPPRAPAPPPTVVVRPRFSWLVAAALVGALVALGAMRLVAALLP